MKNGADRDGHGQPDTKTNGSKGYLRNALNHSALHHFQIITCGFLFNGLNYLFNKSLGYNRLFQ